MKRFSLITVFFMLAFFGANAQPVKLDYFTSVPRSIKNCGAMYTYDSIRLEKRKFFLLADFQNKGMIKIAGKQINLLLTDTKTAGEINVAVYKGSGYTLTLSYTTTNQIDDFDIEEGTLIVMKGAKKISLKIHGQSGCNESKQEGNSN